MAILNIHRAYHNMVMHGVDGFLKNNTCYSLVGNVNCNTLHDIIHYFITEILIVMHYISLSTLKELHYCNVFQHWKYHMSIRRKTLNYRHCKTFFFRCLHIVLTHWNKINAENIKIRVGKTFFYCDNDKPFL